MKTGDRELTPRGVPEFMWREQACTTEDNSTKHQVRGKRETSHPKQKLASGQGEEQDLHETPLNFSLSLPTSAAAGGSGGPSEFG